jgi:hypothetical protein
MKVNGITPDLGKEKSLLSEGRQSYAEFYLCSGQWYWIRIYAQGEEKSNFS